MLHKSLLARTESVQKILSRSFQQNQLMRSSLYTLKKMWQQSSLQRLVYRPLRMTTLKFSLRMVEWRRWKSFFRLNISYLSTSSCPWFGPRSEGRTRTLTSCRSTWSNCTLTWSYPLLKLTKQTGITSKSISLSGRTFSRGSSVKFSDLGSCVETLIWCHSWPSQTTRSISKILLTWINMKKLRLLKIW